MRSDRERTASAPDISSCEGFLTGALFAAAADGRSPSGSAGSVPLSGYLSCLSDLRQSIPILKTGSADVPEEAGRTSDA